VSQDDPNLPDTGGNQRDEDVSKNNVLEDFFQKLPGSFRWPKPDAAAVAAAEEAIHRVASAASGADTPTSTAIDEDEGERACSSCGGLLPAMARFCVWCGVNTKQGGTEVNSASASKHPLAGAPQHHVHHHYHHIVPAQTSSSPADASPTVARGRATAAPPGGRAETTARQLVQDWAQACNTKHISDLLELYAADATLIRPSVPPVRSLPAIREALASVLEAGLGDVEMESLRLEVLGDVAIDLGRCKMLVPVAMGKRREERGKYLVVLVRQPAGGWKILADCWSTDPAVNVPLADAGVRKAG
jgi:ketosteroid isomerase-like protein